MFFIKKILLFGCFFFLFQALIAQDTTALKAALLGRWEVVRYSEQGVPVNKKQNALSQAQTVYNHISNQRALTYYNYDEDSSNRRTRAYERWLERDSVQETNRITEAIAMPYFAVFFADSTLSVYNKEAVTNHIFFPESRHFTFSPTTMSLDITYPGGTGIQWQAQIISLTRERMLLFLPERAEIVELVKTAFSLP